MEKSQTASSFQKAVHPIQLSADCLEGFFDSTAAIITLMVLEISIPDTS